MGLLGSRVPMGEGEVLGLKLPSCFGAGSPYMNGPQHTARCVLPPAGSSEAAGPGLIFQIPEPL